MIELAIILLTLGAIGTWAERTKAGWILKRLDKAMIKATEKIAYAIMGGK